MRQHQDFIAPKLPKALLDRIQDGASSAHKRSAPTRKERRKAERDQKKAAARQPPKPKQPYRRPPPADSTSNSASRGRDRSSPPPPTLQLRKPAAANPKPTTTASGDGAPLKSILKTTKKKDPPPPSSANGTSSPPPQPSVSRAVKDKLAQDDAEIAALEKKLGLKGKKKLPKSFEEDGLHLLLDGLDGDSADEGNGKRKRSEDEEWLRQKRRRVAQPSTTEVLSASEDDTGDEEIDDLLDGLDEDLESDASEDYDQADAENGFDLSDEDGEDEVLGLDEADAFDGFDEHASDDDDDDDDDDDNTREPAPRVRENPYVAPVAVGATPSAPVAPVGKYIPPSMRGAPSSDAESLQRLRRQVQGLLNRLSEANLISILQSVEQIYQSNPRQYVTTTLIDLLLGLICDRTSLMDTFLILHAGFIAALYKVIGTDFGAQVIERIVSDFDTHYAAGAASGKETANLMSLLSELYNFQLVGGNLIFDYIRLFLTELSEPHTELLLKIIRNSGPQLRSDDPSALKDIVVMLQNEVTRIGEANLSVRTKFMIETINNLKNNRMKTGVAASAVVSEHTTRMKKTLGSLNNRSSLKASEPLRIGLNDIRDTEKKGKWWLVGASYHDPAKLAANQDPTEQRRSAKSAAEASHSSADQGTADLVTLARQQGMNTDIRRAIFVTVMSASDYKDAHLRLLKLNFKKTQELEIPRVLIHCTGAESAYNPYYTLIARKLCGEKRMRMAFQFGLWDLFKRMGERDDDDDSGADDDDELTEMSTRKIVNLARMFADLITEGGLPVIVLKTLNFAYLQPKTTTFTEVLLTTVILNSLKKAKKSKWELSLHDIFVKAQDIPDMVQGLRYFVESVVAKADIANGKSERDSVRKGCRIIVKALTVRLDNDLRDGSDE
ncbi:hypothetical protein MBLNU459_g2723t3 [Dothideomycetes sp. NU459]